MKTTTAFTALAIALATFFPIAGIQAQAGALKGRVTDDPTGEPLIFAAVVLFQNGVLKYGIETDFDGAFSFMALPAGVYRMEVSYIGYLPWMREEVVIEAGKMHQINPSMKQGVTLDAITVVEYKVPLIQQDNMSSGSMLTSDQIRRLPTRNANRISASTAGASRGRRQRGQDQVAVRGSRSTETTYYIDGIRVKGSNNRSPAQYPGEDPVSHTEEPSNRTTENDYTSPVEAPFSTFGIDVDQASYTRMRNEVNRYNRLPGSDQVRLEEWVNYFRYAYTPPADHHPFAVQTELSDCPWAAGHWLLSVCLQGYELPLAQAPPTNLVFLIDVSGSMSDENKLPMVKATLRDLVVRLRPTDQVSIVVYAGAAGLVLPPTPVAQQDVILAALDRLSAGGGTAGAQGIELAYETARASFLPNGNNRVVLATDGDFNVGITSAAALERFIANKREQGIFLTTLGFGNISNMADQRMETLADRGNGVYAYIDNHQEAVRVLQAQLTGSLVTIAKDVKLQLRFNPKAVAGYRLLGYENRLMAAEDFEDDAKDGGELGAGHQVTALYEIIPLGQPTGDELMQLELRYKRPRERQSNLILYRSPLAHRPLAEASDNFVWAAAVAESALIVRQSAHKQEANFEQALALAERAKGADPHRAEFIELLRKLSGYTFPLSGAAAAE